MTVNVLKRFTVANCYRRFYDFEPDIEQIIIPRFKQFNP